MKRKSISEYNKLVVYIGTKSPKVDKVFGTDEIMYPGDTIEVISDVANEMVKCTGVYTFPNTPAFAAFVSDNPELALEKGWHKSWTETLTGDKTDRLPPTWYQMKTILAVVC